MVLTNFDPWCMIKPRFAKSESKFYKKEVFLVYKVTLRAARVNVCISQEKAADQIGISKKTLGSWENGITFPPADKIPAICDLYGVPYDMLNFLPTDSLKAKRR